MGGKAWLVGGTLCALLSFGCTSIPKTSEEDKVFLRQIEIQRAEDQKIIDFLSPLCSDGFERHTIFFPDINYIEDLTIDAQLAVAYYDNERLSEMLCEQRTRTVLTHCHHIMYKTLIELTKQDIQMRDERLLAYSILGEETVTKRLYKEFPSDAREGEDGYIVGDMFAALLSDNFFYRYNPEEQLEHRIVIEYEDGWKRMISFGLKEEALLEYKKAATCARRAEQLYDEALSGQSYIKTQDEKEVSEIKLTAMLNNMNFMDMLLEKKLDELNAAYSQLVATYWNTHCQPWTVTDCLEPDFCEFMTDVNASEHFFIEERGWFLLSE